MNANDQSVKAQLIPVQFSAGLSEESIKILKSCRMFTAMESDQPEEQRTLADHVVRLQQKALVE